MIKIIVGAKGTGKTKTLVEMINSVADSDKGNVVCITKGNRLLYDLKHDIRLIEIDEFGIDDYKAFYGFLCGVIAEDFDITHIFIESMTKVVNADLENFSTFVYELDKLLKKFEIEVVITISAERNIVPENILKYCID